MNKFPLPKAANAETIAVYLKQKGDYYRYLAEVATGNERLGNPILFRFYLNLKRVLSGVVEKSQQFQQIF